MARLLRLEDLPEEWRSGPGRHCWGANGRTTGASAAFARSAYPPGQAQVLGLAFTPAATPVGW